MCVCVNTGSQAAICPDHILKCDHTLALCRKTIDGHLKEAQELAEARDSALAAHANVQGELRGLGTIYLYAYAYVLVYKACLHAHALFHTP